MFDLRTPGTDQRFAPGSGLSLCSELPGAQVPLYRKHFGSRVPQTHIYLNVLGLGEFYSESLNEQSP